MGRKKGASGIATAGAPSAAGPSTGQGTPHGMGGREALATTRLVSLAVKRAQEGDSNAFADLFNAHKARIYSLCLRMTNNIAEAEDLTQDAFLQVFRKLATFRGDSALSTWLHRIAVNTVLMHFRKKVLHQVSLDERSEDGKTPRREYGCKDDRLSGTVDRMALVRALNELPAGYRAIFLLHEVHGYEHQEIAQLLDCSVGNSKSQLHKAKLRIRQILARKNTPVELAQACSSGGELEGDQPEFVRFTPALPQFVAS